MKAGDVVRVLPSTSVCGCVECRRFGLAELVTDEMHRGSCAVRWADETTQWLWSPRLVPLSELHAERVEAVRSLETYAAHRRAIAQ